MNMKINIYSTETIEAIAPYDEMEARVELEKIERAEKELEKEKKAEDYKLK